MASSSRKHLPRCAQDPDLSPSRRMWTAQSIVPHGRRARPWRAVLADASGRRMAQQRKAASAFPWLSRLWWWPAGGVVKVDERRDTVHPVVVAGEVRPAGRRPDQGHFRRPSFRPQRLYCFCTPFRFRNVNIFQEGSAHSPPEGEAIEIQRSEAISRFDRNVVRDGWPVSSTRSASATVRSYRLMACSTQPAA